MHSNVLFNRVLLIFVYSTILTYSSLSGKNTQEKVYPERNVDVENVEKLKGCNKKLDECLSECLRHYPNRRDFRQGKCRDYCLIDYKEKCGIPVYIKSNRI